MHRCLHATERQEIIGAFNVLTMSTDALTRRCLLKAGHAGPHLVQRQDQTFVIWVTELCGQEVSVEVANQYLFEREGG